MMWHSTDGYKMKASKKMKNSVFKIELEESLANSATDVEPDCECLASAVSRGIEAWLCHAMFYFRTYAGQPLLTMLYMNL